VLRSSDDRTGWKHQLVHVGRSGVRPWLGDEAQEGANYGGEQERDDGRRTEP
jgi:hypothetical protein